ncbi:hypothetical protein NR756_19470 [Alloalcanivorax xenomutans]|nr:hypothetical protein [Alloalcanivorax xenomutans]
MQRLYIEKNPLAGLPGVSVTLVTARPRRQAIDHPLQIHQPLLEQRQIAPLDGVVNVTGNGNTGGPTGDR